MLKRSLSCFLGKNKNRVYSVKQLSLRFGTNVDMMRKTLYTLMPNAQHVRYGYKTLWGYR